MSVIDLGALGAKEARPIVGEDGMLYYPARNPDGSVFHLPGVYIAGIAVGLQQQIARLAAEQTVALLGERIEEAVKRALEKSRDDKPTE